MTNLTISIDENLLRKARIRALEEGTSVNALLRGYLETFTGLSTARRRAVGRLLALSEAAQSASGGRTWTRNELHER